MLLWMLKIMLLKVLAIAWYLENNIFTLWHRIRIEWWQNGIAWTELRVELCSCLGNYIGKSANISCLPLAMFAREVTKVFQIFVTAAPLTPGTSRTSSKETLRTDGAIARRKDNLQKGILNNDVHTMVIRDDKLQRNDPLSYNLQQHKIWRNKIDNNNLAIESPGTTICMRMIQINKQFAKSWLEQPLTKIKLLKICKTKWPEDTICKIF